MTRFWQACVFALYATAMGALVPLVLLRLWWRGAREPGYRQALGERFGCYQNPIPVPGSLWLHAVSLGETRAAEPLIQALREQQPGLRLLLSHGTATGRQAGQALLRPGDIQVWLPHDTPGAARRFLRRFQPRIGVLMETELWPALLRESERAGLPMVLANARLSERSARKGQRLAALLHPAAARVTLVLAQTEPDADRLVAAGAPQVQVSGNLKFDMSPSPEQLLRGRQWRVTLSRKVVLAACTREGEELPLLGAWRALPAPRPLLLLVPRHPQRFDEVAALVLAQGLSLARRSVLMDQASADSAANATAETARDTARGVALLDPSLDVLLGDSMGEMALYYGCADVALLGGSFAPLGGQNLIEAAACACPLVMGPSTFNFAQAAEQSLAARASLRVDNIEAGIRSALQLAHDPQREEWAQRAQAFAAAHRGAARQMAGRILALMASEK